MIFVCIYLRFKQYLNMIWRDWQCCLQTQCKLKGFSVLSKKMAENPKDWQSFISRISSFLDVCSWCVLAMAAMHRRY